MNIGSGVSILRVDSGTGIKRVTGTLMGGGNFSLIINENYRNAYRLIEALN